MFISRKKLHEIETRLDLVERKTVAASFELGEVDLQLLVKKLTELIKKITAKSNAE